MSNMLENCRICGETTQGTNAKNLFDSDQNTFVHQVELLTGEWLEFGEELPAHICICCEQDLDVAASFRERCIRTQKNLRQLHLNEVPQPDVMDPINLKEEEFLEETNNQKEFYEFENEDLKECSDEILEENFATITFDCTDNANVDENGKSLIKSEEISEENNYDNWQLSQLKATPHKYPVKKRMKLADKRNKLESSGKQIALPKRKKIINWRALTEEQAREMKRLVRQRDCVCDQCGKHFNDPSNLKLHLIRHTGIKNYECEECGAKFYTAHLLKRHSLLHKGVPLYHCDYCEKTFNYSKSKIEHERIHRNEKPFKCGVCEKYFRTTGKLRDHQVVHSRVRRFHCDVCDKWFLARKNLVAHFKSKFHNEQMQNQMV